jgi:hypothetical protein
MTQLFETAVATVSTLPDDVQDELGHLLLQRGGAEQVMGSLIAEEEAELDASIEEESRGEFATDEQVKAMWAKRGL